MNGGVLGIGNAIVDVLTHTDDAFLEHHGFACWGRLPGVARIDGQAWDHLVYGLHLAR